MFFAISPRRWLKLLAAAAIICGVIILISAMKKTAPASAQNQPISVPIIMYHSVCANEALAGKYVLPTRVFRDDMIYLKEHGYETIFVSQLAEYVLEGAPLPDKPVIVTLDDGTLNALTDVLPVLRELDMKAVVSVVGTFSEKYSQLSDANPDYAYLSWEDIRALHDSGLVEIGNHSYDMHSLSTRRGCMKAPGEGDASYRRALENDLEKLQSALGENSGVTPEVFTYPYGLVSKPSLEVVKAMGFKAALTCEERVNRITGDPEELYSLGRFNRPEGVSTQNFMARLS